MEYIYTMFEILFPSSFDYNTKIVLVGVILYSVGCSVIGNFLLLQKRSLLADVLSHATFPGVVIFFIIMLLSGLVFYSKNMLVLTGGALLSTLIAILIMLFFQKYSILKPDAIQAAILSVFFGAGVALLSIAQRIPSGSTAGMMMYIYGNTASMQIEDTYMFILITILVLITLIYHRRSLRILCFDAEYAFSIGINTSRLDFFFVSLIVIQVVIGIQAIGILMVSAMFIIPVVVARFWTNTLHHLIVLSVVISIISGYVGGLLSANSVQYPTGAVIVAVMEVFFIFSVIFGAQKGILIKFIDNLLFSIKMQSEHMLRILYEYIESSTTESENRDRLKEQSIMLSEIQNITYHSSFKLQLLLRYMEIRHLVVTIGDYITLTDKGESEARRVLRNHRLWEAYLLYYTDATPETVDYSADKVEHVLGEEHTNILTDILSGKISREHLDSYILPSPHHVSIQSHYTNEEEKNI